VKEAAERIFQWRRQDKRTIWLLLLRLDQRVPAVPGSPAHDAVLDDEQSLACKQMPLFKIAIFLIVETVKPHSWGSKDSFESFNGHWYRKHAGNLSAAAAEVPPGATAALVAKSQRLGAMSPRTVGLQSWSTSDAYYVEFVREKLEYLFRLLFPSAVLDQLSDSVQSAELMDLLGLLLFNFPHSQRESTGRACDHKRVCIPLEPDPDFTSSN
jgi:hypothetical protein